VPGESVADATIILAAIDPCYCCTERLVKVIDTESGRKWNWEDLLRLSRKKTERIKKEMGISHE